MTTQRAQIEDVVPSESGHCSTCKHYELSGGASPVGRALPREHTCLRYKHTVTGDPLAVPCTAARNDERLCGAPGRHYEDRLTRLPDAHVAASAGVATATRRGRPRKLNGAHALGAPATVDSTE